MSHRASALPRPSTYGPSSQSGPAMTRKNEKKQEYEAVAALDRLCAQLASQAEGVANEADILADGGVGTCISDVKLQFSVNGI